MKTIYFFLSASLILSACGEKKPLDEKTVLESQIDSLEALLLNDSLEVDQNAAAAAIKAYLKYADTYGSTDSNAADYLFKAADVMRGMFRYEDAVQTLELVIKRFPNSNKAPTALFYAGFILHADIQHNQKAMVYFQRLIDEFPTHPLSDDARNLMPLLNLSDEQLLEFLNRSQPS
jgi:TolA-binding protein